MLELFQGQAGLIAHTRFRVIEHGVEQAFHQDLLPRFHQVGIQPPQGPGAVRAHRRLTINPQTQEQLGRGGIGLGGARTPRFRQGAGRPEPHGSDIHLEGPGQGVEHRGIGIAPQAPGHGLPYVTVVVGGQQAQQILNSQGTGVTAQGVDRAHPHDRAWGPKQRQQQGQGPGVPVLTKDAQPLHPLVVITHQQGQAQIAFSRHISRLRIAAIERIEGIAQQLLGELLGQHVEVEVELLGALIEGARAPKRCRQIGLEISHNGCSADRCRCGHISRQPNAGTHRKQGQAKQQHDGRW